MVRRHGLAIDSLAAVQVATADGRLIGADAVEHADLFWALRGGGGNFGVAVGSTSPHSPSPRCTSERSATRPATCRGSSRAGAT